MGLIRTVCVVVNIETFIRLIIGSRVLVTVVIVVAGGIVILVQIVAGSDILFPDFFSPFPSFFADTQRKK